LLNTYNRKMKRIIKITLGLLFVIVITLIAVPYFLKDDIEKFIKEEINNSINAKLDYDNINLSLFKDFPNLHVKIDNITLDGIQEFDSIRLAHIDKFNMSLDAKRLFFEKDLEIKKIGIDGADLNIVVLKNGKANYDIAKPDTTQTNKPAKNYEIKLKSYQIHNANIYYNDQSLGMRMKIKNLQHQGTGVFTKDAYKLKTESQMDTLDVVYDNIHYLNNVKSDINTGILIENDFSKYTIKDADISLNDLDLTSNMMFDLKGDDIIMDITYQTKQNSFNKLLSLIPKAYMPNLKGVKTKGTASLKGFVKGTYNDNNYPAYGVDLNTVNGYIKYPDLPQDVKDINVVVNVDFPGGNNLDKTTIKLPKVHFVIANNPADGYLSIKNPMSDPFIDTKFKSKMDLSTIKQAIHLPEIKQLTGQLDADIKLKGRSSAIEKQAYKKFEASGYFNLKDLSFQSDSLAYPVAISQAEMRITPQALDLQKFKSKIGESDFDITGKVTNYITYFLKDNQKLKADFNLSSNYINLNEFMTVDETGSNNETASDSIIKIPKNLDIIFNANVKKVLYKDLSLNDIKGKIKVANQKAEMETVLSKTLSGNMQLNGVYDTSEEIAQTSMKLNMKNLSINQSADKLTMFKTYAPVMKKINGNFFSDLQMDVALDSQMNPQLETLDASGLFKTENINVAGIEVLKQIGNLLKIKTFDKAQVDKIKAQFEVKQGKMHVKPFKFKLNEMQSELSGNVGLDQKINFVLNMDVPRKLLGNKANEILENLVGKANLIGLKTDLADIIKMKFKITGNYNHPKIVPVIAGAEGSSVKEVITQAVEQKVEEVVDDAKEKAKAEAQKKADELMVQAQKQADKLVSEAKKVADRIRAEAQKQADELVKKAGDDPFKKLAAQTLAKKIVQEADKKAKQVEQKAQNQANLVLQDARKRADSIINNSIK